MAKQGSIEQFGIITENLSNSMFRVELDNGIEIICQLVIRLKLK